MFCDYIEERFLVVVIYYQITFIRKYSISNGVSHRKPTDVMLVDFVVLMNLENCMKPTCKWI